MEFAGTRAVVSVSVTAAGPPAGSVRRPDNSVSNAGSRISEENMQQLTPIVSTRPRLSKPRWAEIIRLPNPIIVVSDVSNTAVAVDPLMR